MPEISEIVREYLKPVYSYAFRLTGDSQVAEDIAQETFVKVWKNLDRYDSKQSFKTRLFTIAHSTAIDYLRKRKSIPFSQLSFGNEENDENSFAENIADQVPLAEEQLAKLDTQGELQKLLEKLPPATRELLTLRYQNDLTFAEIATILNLPLNTVKSTHRRALIPLRKLASAPK